jgi:indolepyruvate ferredoxin oxidoreductase alpha subunit
MGIGCPAIIDMGEYLEVNEALCVGCRLCTKVCNFDAFEKAGDNNG